MLGVIAVASALIAVVLLFTSENRTVQIVSTGIIVAFVVYWSASDWIEAWLNERHVERHPHLLRNDAIGETVTACGDFEAVGGSSRGSVLLHGEKWNARCAASHLPHEGDALRVSGRSGLTLEVVPHDAAAAARPHAN